MQIAFPPNILVGRIRPRLEGLRQSPFTNVDGEVFGRPALNGMWRIQVELIASTELQFLALSAFLTSMRGYATTLLPMTTRWTPNGANGRKLYGFAHDRVAGQDRMSFASQPFDGFTLRAPASQRDSYIDVNTPSLSKLMPGHFITLGKSLHQVVNVTSIGEHPTRWRVSIMPNVRGDFPVGHLVVVDHLQLAVQLEEADDPESWNIPHAAVKATFIEAF